MLSNISLLTAALAITSAAAPLTKRTSSKGGVVYNDGAVTQYFKGGPLTWMYNYESDFGNNVNTQLNYHPMLHDLSSQRTSDWSQNAKNAIAQGATALLGFNEPDQAGQANLTPDQAANAWRQYFSEFYDSKVTLVSPAVSSQQGDPNKGLEWMKSFLSSCSDCKIDAIAIHWYGQAADTPAGLQNFRQFVNDATALGKPVWVTEYGFDDVDAPAPTYSEQQKETALKSMISFLDGNDGVAKHSYFMASTDGSGKQGSLVSGNGLSALGKIYNS